MQANDYSFLEGGQYDFEEGLDTTFNVHFGLENSTEEAQKQSNYFQSFTASSSFFMIGGAIPQNSSNPLGDWRKSVATNLSALDYQIYPLSELFGYKEFKDLNTSDLTQSFSRGLAAYCEKHGCRAPSPDSPFPFAAQSKIVQEGQAGVRNYDALDMEGRELISFRSKFSDQMSPLLQICFISFCCQHAQAQLQGFLFQLCDTLNEPQEIQMVGNYSTFPSFDIINWTRPLTMDPRDYLNTVHFFYGYADPMITNLKFQSKMGYETDACRTTTRNSQFSKGYTFEDPIVGFAGKYLNGGSMRYLEFYQNNVQYNYSAPSPGAPTHPD